MNILFYQESLAIGGVRRVTEILTEELTRLGHNVAWLCWRRRDVAMPECLANENIYWLPEDNAVDSSANVEYYSKLVQSLNINVVINQDGLYEGIRLIDACPQVPRISVLHSNPALNLQWLWRDQLALRNDTFTEKLKRIARLILYPRTRRIITAERNAHFARLAAGGSQVCLLSKQYANTVRNFCPAITKISAIANPNTYAAISSVPKEKIVLYVGRLDNRSKKVQTLLRIWNEVSPQAPDWRLILVGDGHDRASLEKQAASLHNVEFVGFADPTPYYERASVICMTSLFEGFPMILTEAMQHGCVPIAFDSFAAVHDIIDDGKDGILIKPFNRKAYADNLLHLMHNDTLLRDMSVAAVQKAHNFDRAPIIQQWLQLINETSSR